MPRVLKNFRDMGSFKDPASGPKSTKDDRILLTVLTTGAILALGGFAYVAARFLAH